MDALDRKLLRDFRRLWAQALAIALVLACGVAILMTTFGMYQALNETRAAYYERNRFADLFAQTRRAPLTLMPEIRAIEGVYAVEPRVTGAAILTIPGRAENAVGRILSLPASGPPTLNEPILRSGRYPDPGAANEVMVNEPFARANGFALGDTFEANLNGSLRPLTITGTFLSPEFIYTIGPGALMPDNEGFGILMMPEPAVAAAFDMSGAFNSVSLKLTASARPEAVKDALDRILEPYGGLGAYDRIRQESHAFIDAEIKQLRSMSVILPPIFFGISAFLVNMVIGRIVMLERSEIGLMKAIGYSDTTVLTHYVLLAVLIAVGGLAVGWPMGSWLTFLLARLYAQFFDFPFLIFTMSYEPYVVSGVLALLTAALGAAQSALRAARMPPAVAMLPPAPPRFRRSMTDRLLQFLRLSQPVMMILRSLMRWPLRSFLNALGLALAVAILVSSSFFTDAMEEIIDSAFYQSNRQDAILLLSGDIKETALEEVRRLPGVMQAEGQLSALAILRNGHLSKHVPIEARRAGADLARIVDGDGHPREAPGHGILLAERLAAQLDLQPGETVEIEFLTGRRETVEVTVAGTVPQYFGLGAYMDFEALNALFRQTPQITMAHVTLDSAADTEFHAAVQDLPKLVSTIMLTDTRSGFQDTIEQNIGYMTTIYIVIASLITIGVAYNGARIQLSERARELASLRILGFSRGEVSFILVGETMLLALLAQPLGWLIGAGIAKAAVEGFTSDLYRIPLVLKPDTFAKASIVVLIAALVAALVVRRRLDNLDLVAAMKTRE
ncbi:MAG: ABC transporter permease [Rhodobacteraceae bacterium]|nr:ABC transporter permease [Paracoccaceae bacterium]